MQDVQFIYSVAEPRQRETTGKNRLALQRREPRAVSDQRDRVNLDARWRRVVADYMGRVLASKTASGGVADGHCGGAWRQLPPQCSS
jgi:hypothetical protein